MELGDFLPPKAVKFNEEDKTKISEDASPAAKKGRLRAYTDAIKQKVNNFAQNNFDQLLFAPEQQPKVPTNRSKRFATVFTREQIQKEMQKSHRNPIRNAFFLFRKVVNPTVKEPSFVEKSPYAPIPDKEQLIPRASFNPPIISARAFSKKRGAGSLCPFKH